MIYEVAEGEEVELRNDHVGFVDYVPMGSLAKGRTVAMGNRGQMRTCGSCHGDDYRGHEDAPRLAGRSAYYLIRQLADMRAGNRKGAALGKMKDIVPQAVGCRHPQRRRFHGLKDAVRALRELRQPGQLPSVALYPAFMSPKPMGMRASTRSACMRSGMAGRGWAFFTMS